MNFRRIAVTGLLTIILLPAIFADEGMWIPLLIGKYNIKLMQDKGFKLSAEDIYSVNRACMKDAVVQFGGGCTGELISSNGLLITNHHCGYSQIQRHSDMEHDYLTNGFWAMAAEEELPNPGLTVTFLRSMEEVTDKVLQGVSDTMSTDERDNIINNNIGEIIRNATGESGYTASVKPFFMGQQYFLFINETFRDVRLVGAPPSAIGKFGGETDNWIWPRHTGDFSLFRIYAGKDNKPADYSKENVPYKPLYHFAISLKGIKEGDFTMVFGYPGTTSEYVPSFYVDMVKNYFEPLMIALRSAKIEIMEKAMNSDPAVRIQYSAKKSGLANSWKRWQGESLELGKMSEIERKQDYEKRLTVWINTDSERKLKYGNILSGYKELYQKYRQYYIISSYTAEVFFNSGTEAVSFARNAYQMAGIYAKVHTGEQVDALRANLLHAGESFFKNYDRDTDKKLFVALMTLYGENVAPEWQVPEYLKLKKSCGGDFNTLVERLYKKTVFADKAKYDKFLAGFTASSVSMLEKDPFYVLGMSVSSFLEASVRPELIRLNTAIQELNRKYLEARMEFEKDKLFYPDANSTLRVAYGTIKGYFPEDAVYYNYYTTLKGIMEKDNPAVYDYDVPERLKALYETKDYGPYSRSGEMPYVSLLTIIQPGVIPAAR